MKIVGRLFTMAAAGSALIAVDTAAADRSVTTPRKSRAVTEETLDVLSMTAQPEVYQGKAVRIYCERLRNPDSTFMTCRADGVSIVVETRYLSADALRYAFENCQGMMSTCSGTVSGVATFVRGVPYISQAALEFSQE